EVGPTRTSQNGYEMRKYFGFGILGLVLFGSMLMLGNAIYQITGVATSQGGSIETSTDSSPINDQGPMKPPPGKPLAPAPTSPPEAEARTEQPMIEVCVLQRGEIVEIKSSQFNTSLHSKELQKCRK